MAAPSLVGFSAGNVTLSSFVGDTTSLNSNFVTGKSTNDPANLMLIPTGTSFDFNWSANTTDGHTSFSSPGAGNQPPQVVAGTGVDPTSLTLEVALNAKYFPLDHTSENAELVYNGQTIAAGNTTETIVINGADMAAT